ncbi:hypothetical protein LCGC14_2700420 [marine sediment metagenome]|uniref:Uncharacterized protein n=1 Tax=marine sediment metagenome TaxID=412755 RepID=A0A0F9BQ68_9ZZZZ
MNYELPQPQTTPEGAAAELRKVYGASQSDPKHPHRDGAHIMHGDFMKAITALHVVKVQELQALEDADRETVQSSWSGPSLKIMKDAMDVQQGKNATVQSQLRKDITEEIEQINKLFPGTDIDIAEQVADPTPNKLNSYRQMRMLGQGDYASLKPLVMADMESLGLPTEQAEAMESIFNASGSGFGKTLINSMIKKNFVDKQARIDNPPVGFGEPAFDHTAIDLSTTVTEPRV